MSCLDPFCSAYFKTNILQQIRDEEPERKSTSMEWVIMIGGNGVDDNLFDIKLLS